MTFRLNSSQLFLTYPQCTLTKEKMLEELTEKVKPRIIKDYIIAHELHANGDHHLHCYLKLDEKTNYRDPKCLDIGTYHGNYQGCRSSKNVMKYVTKAEDYISNLDVEEIIQKRNTKKRILGQKLISGQPLVKLIEEFPEYIFGYKKLKEDVNEYFKDKEDNRGSLPYFLPNPWGKVLLSQKKAKRRHYWIFSRAPNKGKTTLFAEPLNKDYKCYIKAGDFSYWNIRGDEEAIILDEYNTPALKWSSLNSMADGNFEYRVFQGGVQPLKKPLIIILSNQSIVDLYPYMNNLLYERFIEFEIV